MPEFLLIFIEFFKTGLFSIGGGLATLPFLFKMAENNGWFTTEQLTNMIAVSESTPGPIGVNVATYAGYKISGVPGAVWATLSLVLPSIIVILIIAGILEKFAENKIVKNVFFGLRPAVVGLLAVSLVKIIETTFVNVGGTNLFEAVSFLKLGAFALIFFLLKKFKKHPILYVAIGAVFGVAFRL